MDSSISSTLPPIVERMFRREVQIIRAHKNLLAYMPVKSATHYGFAPKLLMNRLFSDGNDQSITAAFNGDQRPGSLLVPRIMRKESPWSKFFTEIIDEDFHIQSEINNFSFDETRFNSGEDVELVNCKNGKYLPSRLNDLLDRLIKAQQDYLITVLNFADQFPTFASLYFGIKPSLVSQIPNISPSSLMGIKHVMVFPRIITFSQDDTDSLTTKPIKASAWAFELFADIKLGFIKSEFIELLRHDTQFKNNRQDLVSLLIGDGSFGPEDE
ncbi:UNVERIFIED_ORG: hypothetical protein M2414_005165 [Rahnella aquatilis]